MQDGAVVRWSKRLSNFSRCEDARAASEPWETATVGNVLTVIGPGFFWVTQ